MYNKIIKIKLANLANCLRDNGNISESERIQLVSELLKPGETWFCPIDEDFFNEYGPEDKIIDDLKDQHENIIEDLKKDLDQIG